jgi:cell division protein FtsN
MARRSRQSRRNDSTPGWVWMMFGLGLGLAVAVVVYLRLPAKPFDTEPSASRPAAATRQPAEPSPRRDAATAQRTASQQEAPASAAASQPPTTGNRFDFYEVLPQLEVVVTDDTTRAASPRPRPAEAPGSFLLQAGSFSAAADADRLQANLALLGFESHVQRVTIDNSVFHRVRIGPIDDADAAKKTQRALREQGIDSLLMRVPK